MRPFVAEHPDVEMRLALQGRLVPGQSTLDISVVKLDHVRLAEHALNDLRVSADVVPVLFRLHVLWVGRWVGG